MNMKQIRGPAFVTGIVAVLLLTASNALADEIKTFDLVAANNTQGTYSLDLAGWVVIDTTTGVVDSIDLGLGYPWYSVGTSSGALNAPMDNLIDIWQAWCVGQSPACLGFISAGITLPVDSLVGYDGGPICSTEYPCLDGDTSFYYFGLNDHAFISGDLEPSPEPSSLILALTGALGIAAALRRKNAQSDRTTGAQST